MIKYTYRVSGSAANGQTWGTLGAVQTDEPQQFTAIIEQALQDSFERLTQGKAIFGHPGLGCNGPYHISKFTIEEDL